MRPLLPAAALGALAAAAAALAPSMVLDLRRPALHGSGMTLSSVIKGGEPLEWAGSQLAGGDINGDGISDLAIAAPGGTEDRPSRRGRIYVILGGVAPPRPSLDLKLRLAPAASPGAPAGFTTGADITVNGGDDSDHLGRSLAVADLDADGFADIIAGAPRADGPGNSRHDCGEVWVIHGAAIMPRVVDLASGPSAVVRIKVVYGRSPGDALGSTLQAADISGDGAIDLVMAAPLAEGEAGSLGAIDVGEVVLIPGGSKIPDLVDLADGGRGVARPVLRGSDPGDQAGSALALGDFDGDSVADLAVGARGGDGPSNQRPDSGEVYLVFGAEHLSSIISLGMQAAALIASPDIGDLGGSSLAFGDIDADGRADLAIGAESADGRGNSRLDAGDVYLVFGRSRQMLEALRPPSLGAARPGHRVLPGVPESQGEGGPVLIDLASSVIPGVSRLHGTDSGDHTAVRGVADLNLDGFMDLLIGAEDSSSRRNSRAGGGEARVIAGRGGFPARIALEEGEGLTLYGPMGGAHLGKAALALDMNGDSRPELILSGPQAGQSLAGQIWVVSASWTDHLRPARLPR